MSRVAIATCARDVDLDSRVLLGALARAGVDARLCVWDDPDVRWNDFDLTVIRSTWDYSRRLAQFLEWARGVERLANPFEVVEYSSDKHYLGDLAARGVAVVATTYCDRGTEPTFPDGDFVVKPCVGAGSMDVERYGRGARELEAALAHVERLHAEGRDVLVQPYVHSVDEMGERALVFIDGAFSHAMTKGAMLNVSELDRHALFRREQMSLASVEPDALTLAEAALAGFDGLLYARVDLVREAPGWQLMELELVEPSLFLGFDDAAPARLADAIRRRAARPRDA